MALTLASLTKTAKKCSINTAISEEEFLNALLKPYIDAGRIKRRKGEEFVLDKSRTSKILNGHCDVPVELRKALVRYGIEEGTANNLDVFFQETVDVSLFSFLAQEIIDTVDSKTAAEKELKDSLANATNNPNLFMARALIGAIRADNKATTSKCLWCKGSASVHLEIGDLFTHGFGRARKTKEIVVVPVNTTFDTKVTWAYENNPKPLVSSITLHGKWLVRMEESGVTTAELDERIEKSIQQQGIKAIAKQGLGTSSKPEYPIGTVAIIENSHAVFYLLAISRFDENNNAQSDDKLLVEALERLLALYDRCGQGLDLYLPLIGTGMSRTKVSSDIASSSAELMSHQQAYDLIISTLASNAALLHGKVTVVVYKNEKEKLHLPIS